MVLLKLAAVGSVPGSGRRLGEAILPDSLGFLTHERGGVFFTINVKISQRRSAEFPEGQINQMQAELPFYPPEPEVGFLNTGWRFSTKACNPSCPSG